MKHLFRKIVVFAICVLLIAVILMYFFWPKNFNIRYTDTSLISVHIFPTFELDGTLKLVNLDKVNVSFFLPVNRQYDYYNDSSNNIKLKTEFYSIYFADPEKPNYINSESIKNLMGDVNLFELSTNLLNEYPMPIVSLLTNDFFKFFRNHKLLALKNVYFNSYNEIYTINNNNGIQGYLKVFKPELGKDLGYCRILLYDEINNVQQSILCQLNNDEDEKIMIFELSIILSTYKFGTIRGHR